MDGFEELGDSGVDIMTLQDNDGNRSAARPFKRVRKVAANPGFSLITNGSANPKLLSKANDYSRRKSLR